MVVIVGSGTSQAGRQWRRSALMNGTPFLETGLEMLHYG
jgi:hypothetical protein